MLINALDILNGGNVIQFNINNLEWTRMILEECNSLNRDVILGVSERALKYMGGPLTVYNMVVGLISDLGIRVKVCLHLDHGKSVDICRKCIDVGFTSVMFDGSQWELDNNIGLTKEVVDYARRKGVSVEGEVSSLDVKSGVFDVKKYVLETGVDMVAPSVGNIHGYGKMDIDIDLVKEINEMIDTPLVLHGGSGISLELLKELVGCGINKININTDLQYAWGKAVHEFVLENALVYDLRMVIGAGEQALRQVVKEKLSVLD